MTQTRRTLAAVMANLPNNTTGQIRPVHVRDAVISVVPVRGGYYMATDNTTATSILQAGEWTHIAGVTTEIQVTDPCKFAMTGPNEATYTEGPPLILHFSATLGMESAAGNQAFSVAPEIGGQVLAPFRVPVFFTAQDRRESLTVLGQWPVESGDTFRLMVRNDTSDSNVTVGTMSVSLLGMVRCVGSS